MRAGAVLATVTLLTAWSVAVQGVTGLWTSAVTGRGEDLVALLRTQQGVDSALGVTGPPVLRDVTDLPADAAPDTLATGPDCSALYLATGDRYEPWVLVEAVPTVLSVTLHRGVRSGRVPLARYEGSSTREVVLETRADHHVRVVVEDGDDVTAGPWYGVYPETSTTVGIAIDAHYSLVEVTTTPGGRVDVFPAQRIDEHWVIHPGRVVLLPDRQARAEALGVTLAPGPAGPRRSATTSPPAVGDERDPAYRLPLVARCPAPGGRRQRGVRRGGGGRARTAGPRRHGHHRERTRGSEPGGPRRGHPPAGAAGGSPCTSTGSCGSRGTDAARTSSSTSSTASPSGPPSSGGTASWRWSTTSIASSGG